MLNVSDLLEQLKQTPYRMIEVATRTEVLRVLGATTVGVLMLIPPNFWAEVIGTAAGYLIPEAIIAILFLVIAGFTGGSAGPALAARLTAFATSVVGKMRTVTNAAGRSLLAMFTFLRGLVDKIRDLVSLRLKSRRERAIGSTDVEIPLARKIVSITITDKQLQKKFKHADDFGVDGNYNPDSAGEFRRAIVDHVNSPETREVVGTYRGNPVTFHVNQNTGLVVLQDPGGSFLSGWKLNGQQLHHVVNDGKL